MKNRGERRMFGAEMKSDRKVGRSPPIQQGALVPACLFRHLGDQITSFADIIDIGYNNFASLRLLLERPNADLSLERDCDPRPTKKNELLLGLRSYGGYQTKILFRQNELLHKKR